MICPPWMMTLCAFGAAALFAAMVYFSVFDTKTKLGSLANFLRFNDSWGTLRGFVYVRESEELMDQVRQIAYDTLLDDLESGDIDRMEMKSHIRDSISKFLYAKTKRKPMILPVIMNV